MILPSKYISLFINRYLLCLLRILNFYALLFAETFSIVTKHMNSHDFLNSIQPTLGSLRMISHAVKQKIHHKCY